MAGFAQGVDAHATFAENLRYACAHAEGRTILIEPLNGYDAPGYFLNQTTQAAALIEEVGAPNLRLMFDCYHVQLTEGDVTHRLERLMPIIGHIQVASVPDRGAFGSAGMGSPDRCGIQAIGRYGCQSRMAVSRLERRVARSADRKCLAHPRSRHHQG